MSTATIPSLDYNYETLRSTRAFRLLTLLDSVSFDAPVECSIETHELEEDGYPAYTALSYTWGDSSRDASILVNGAHMKVTPTLVKTLRHMRQIQRTRDDINGRWWVDMVCINQDDTAERGQQVGVMRDIFHDAKLTVAWLGPAANDSDVLMDYLNGNGGYEHEIKTATAPKKESKSSRKAFRAWTSSPEGKLAIRSFRERPYWQRAWIIQEVCVSQNVLLVCGDKTSPWKRLDVQHKWLHTYPEAHAVPDLRVIRHRFQDTNLALSFLIYRAAMAQCTNPRDRVYSLLGLVSAGQYGAKIVPDYALSPCSVYSAAIRAAYKDLDITVKPSGRQWIRAKSFREKFVLIMNEVKRHEHDPLNEEADEARSGCNGYACEMWDLCWRFCGITSHLE